MGRVQPAAGCGSCSSSRRTFAVGEEDDDVLRDGGPRVREEGRPVAHEEHIPNERCVAREGRDGRGAVACGGQGRRVEESLSRG